MADHIFVSPFLKHALMIFIASVWLINGLFCKVLNLVPRHQLIVSAILGNHHAVLFTKFIGISEVLMTIWIVSNVQSQLCAVVQIVVVALMNVIELIKVPHLLLFGRINILVAVFFIAVIYINAFVMPQYINP